MSGERKVGRIELTAQQAYIFDTFTHRKPVVVENEPNAHTVWLDVGPQHFQVFEFMETAESADWMRAQLTKALSRLVSDVAEADALIAALEQQS